MEPEADKSLDPAPPAPQPNATGRYVLLHHHYPNDASNGVSDDSARRRDHHDLMLESNGILQTWALDEFPVSGKSFGATRLPDHRIEYLDYEGVISDNRGTVKRVGQGSYETHALPEKKLLVRLNFGDQLLELELRSESNLTTIFVR